MASPILPCAHLLPLAAINSVRTTTVPAAQCLFCHSGRRQEVGAKLCHFAFLCSMTSSFPFYSSFSSLCLCSAARDTRASITGLGDFLSSVFTHHHLVPIPSSALTMVLSFKRVQLVNSLALFSIVPLLLPDDGAKERWPPLFLPSRSSYSVIPNVSWMTASQVLIKNTSG